MLQIPPYLQQNYILLPFSSILPRPPLPPTAEKTLVFPFPEKAIADWPPSFHHPSFCLPPRVAQQLLQTKRFCAGLKQA
jgi:hypothetical protein